MRALNLAKTLKLAGSAAAIALSLAAGNANAIDIPPPGGPQCSPVPAGTQNCIQFQDFTVYSLAFLNFQAGSGDINGNDPYAVSSNGDAINNAVVIASSPGGRVDNQDLSIAGHLDNAYNTPNDAGSNVNFLMSGQTDPIPTPFIGAGDNVQGNLWDIQISSLNTFLGGSTPVFLFNLNEENGSGLDGGQDMYAWLRVTLTDLATNTSISFTLGGGSVAGCVAANPTCALQSGADAILPTAADTWAYVHGQICEADGSVIGHPASELLGFGACTQAQKDNGGQTVNQNLGDNVAAFALVSDGLNSALTAPGSIWDIMSVDLRMAHVGNGYEQLYLVAANAIPPEIPEPATLSLLGTGLALLGLGRLRRKRAKKA